MSVFVPCIMVAFGAVGWSVIVGFPGNTHMFYSGQNYQTLIILFYEHGFVYSKIF